MKIPKIRLSGRGLGRRLLASLVVLIVGAVFGAVLAGKAIASKYQQHAYEAVAIPGSVDLLLSADKAFSPPATLPAGPATFRAHTYDKTGHTLLLARMHDGVPVSRFLGHLAQLSAGAANTSAQQASYDDADNLGGALINSYCPVSFSVTLTAGNYVLIDFASVGVSDTHPKVRELTVTGEVSRTALPVPNAAIVLDHTADKPRFLTPQQVPSKATFQITNSATNADEAAFLHLKPGVTEADLKVFFAAFDAGNVDWTTAPFSGGPCGLAPMSPGHQAVLHMTLNPGVYALASFTLDPKTRKREAAQGMYQIVTAVS